MPDTIEQFASKIKAKYPQYQNVEDSVLVEKIIAKYPQYKSQVSQPAQQPKPVEYPSQLATAGGLLKPAGTYKPQETESPFKVPTNIPQAHSEAQPKVQSGEVEKKEKAIQFRNTAVDRAILEKKKKFGGNIGDEENQKQAIRDQIDKGDLVISRDKHGEPILKRGTGLIDSFKNSVEETYQRNLENDVFAGMNAEQRAARLKFLHENPDLQAESETAPSGTLGKVGQFIGENIALVGKGTIGAMAAGVAAPAAIGAGSFGSFVGLAGDMANTGYTSEAQRTYNELKQQGVSDEEAAKKAHIAGLKGAAVELGIDAALSHSFGTHSPAIKAAVNAWEKVGALGGSVKKVLLQDAPKMGGVTALGSLAKAKARQDAGVDISEADAYKEAAQAGVEGYELGVAFGIPHILPHIIGAAFETVRNASSVPSPLRPIMENVLASMPAEQRQAIAKKAEESGAAPEGFADYVEAKVELFKEAKDPYENLPISEEKKAAIAGKRIQLSKAKTPEEATRIQKEIEDIFQSKDPLDVEADGVTGEKISFIQPGEIKQPETITIAPDENQRPEEKAKISVILPQSNQHQEVIAKVPRETLPEPKTNPNETEATQTKGEGVDAYIGNKSALDESGLGQGQKGDDLAKDNKGVGAEGGEVAPALKDVESKKADIERRRKEDLESLDFFHPKYEDAVRYIAKRRTRGEDEILVTPASIQRALYLNENGGKSIYEQLVKDGYVKDKYVNFSEKEAYRLIEYSQPSEYSINAKYDTELSNLTRPNKNEPTPTETNNPLPSNESQPKKQRTESGVPKSVDGIGHNGAEPTDAVGVAKSSKKAVNLQNETDSRLSQPRGNGAGGNEVGSLAPLKGAPTVQGATGPDANLVKSAERYAQENGIPLKRQAEYAKIDETFSRRIADAYEAMPHDPTNPVVKEAYDNLIKQTREQYDALVKDGYEFSFFDEATDPYEGNPYNAIRDLRQNKRMAVYGTYDGYGTEGITAKEIENSPMLADTGLRWKDQSGQERMVTANDLFRAVHDAFGHGLEGSGFRARGEENAWQAHSRLFTGSAVGAMTTETRGQNSWLNFGPYGEQNKNAKVEDTVFAEQKVGLMPEWTWMEGRVGDAKIAEGTKIDSEKETPTNAQKNKAEANTGISSPSKQSKNKSVRDKEAAQALASSVKTKGSNKAMAEWLRSKKLKGGAMVTVDFGLTKEVYNGAIEFIAKQVEKGTKVGNAIAEAMKRIDKAMGGKKWDKATFGKEMSKTYTMKVNGQDEVVTRDDTKETAKVINGFYSPLEQRILDSKDEKLPANKWAERLKSDEAKWTGVQEFLESKGSAPVSKAELKDFMKNNRIEIVEVVKQSGFDTKSDPKSLFGSGEFILEKKDDDAPYLYPYNVVRKDGSFVQEVKSYEDALENISVINAARDYVRKEGKIGSPKYSQYQLSGEKENYKEVLITLPRRNVPSIEEYNRYASLKEYADKLAKRGRTQQEIYEAISDSRDIPVAEVKSILSKPLQDPNAPQYKSSHWDEENILSHIRMNTRLDSEGKRVLFLEEVQSDAQQGNRKGAKIWTAPFVDDTNSITKLSLKTALRYAVEEGADKVAWATGTQQNDRYDLSKQVDYITKHKESEANKELGEIDVFISLPNGTVAVSVDKATGKVTRQGGQSVAGDLKGKGLDDVVGKDMAEKLLSLDENEHKLEGNDLKIGGRGMKGFYGEPSEGKEGIIGGVAKALVKELTGKEGVIVGTKLPVDRVDDKSTIENLESVIASQKEDLRTATGDYKVRLERRIERQEEELQELKKKQDPSFGNSTQHSIEITPELRESVKQGMPLFGEAKTNSFSNKIRAAAQDIRENGIKGLQANLPEGTQTMGAGGMKSFNEATARAMEIFADAIDRVGDFAKAVDEGFAHLKNWYEENTKSFKEDKVKSLFEAEAKRLYDEFNADGKDIGITKKDLAELAADYEIEIQKRREEMSDDEISAMAKDLIQKGYNVYALVKKSLSDSKFLPSDIELNILAEAAADMQAKIDANSSNADIAKYRDILSAINRGTSELGRGLRMAKVKKSVVESIADVMANAMDDNMVDELTPKQRAEAEARFKEIEGKLEIEKKLREQAEAEIKKLKAAAALNAAKKRATGKKKSSTDYATERKNIVSSIREKWKNAGKDTLSSDIPYRKQLAAIAPDVARLIRSYVEEAADITIEKVRSLLKKDIEEAGIEISDDEVRGLIAGEFNEKKETRNELTEQVFNLRREEKLLIELDKLQSGEVPVNESAKIKRNQKLTDLRKKIDEIKKQKGIGKYSDEAKFETSLKQRIAANQAKQNQLQERIKNNDFSENEQPKSIVDNVALQQKNPELYEKYLKSVVDRDNAMLAYERKRIADKMANRSKFEKAKDALSTAVLTSKGTVAMFDQSVLLVQMLAFSMSHPLRAMEYVPRALVAMFNKSNFDRKMAKLHGSDKWDVIEKSGLAIYEPHSAAKELRNELFGGDKNLWNKDIVLGGKKYSIGQAFERATSSLLDNARLYLFEQQVKNLQNAGKTFDNSPEKYKAAARAANELTGHGKVAEALDGKTAEVLNHFIWSPKMFSSSLNLLGLGDIVRLPTKHKGMYGNLSPEARRFVIGEMTRFATTGALILLLGKLLYKQVDDETEYDLNPFSSRFGSLKIGDKSFSVYGRFGSVIRTVLQASANKTVVNGKEIKLGERYGSKTAGDVIFGSFVRGKMTPLSGVGYDYLLNNKKNYFTREKLDLATIAEGLSVPLALQQVPTDIERNGTIKGIGQTLFKLYGGNVFDEKDFYKNDIGGEVGKFLEDNKLRVSEPSTITIPTDDKHPEGKPTAAEFKSFLKERSDKFNEVVANAIKSGKIKSGDSKEIQEANQKEISRIGEKSSEWAKKKIFGQHKKTTDEIRAERRNARENKRFDRENFTNE